MSSIEVFADISCPFTHVGLLRFVAERARRGLDEPRLQVRAWPLEVVNGEGLTGPALVPKIAALQRDVAPELFRGFDPVGFPATTLPALAAEVAARRNGPDAAESFSLAVRHALFEDGKDISDPGVLDGLMADHGVTRRDTDRDAVFADHTEGVQRGVTGSPYFIVGDRGFFCPSLDIRHDQDGYDIEFDAVGFDAFIQSVER